MRHIISATVENKPGVLARIVGIITGRGYNIETLNVAPGLEPDISRLTMTMTGDDAIIEQVAKQLNKMVDVIKVSDLTADAHLEGEYLFATIATPRPKRSAILETLTLLKAEVLVVNEKEVTVQFYGNEEAIAKFFALLKSHITDLSRSGPIAIAKGAKVGTH